MMGNSYGAEKPAHFLAPSASLVIGSLLNGAILDTGRFSQVTPKGGEADMGAE